MTTLLKKLNCAFFLLQSAFYTLNVKTQKCKPHDSSLSPYWTTKNPLRPDGCIDRSNVTIAQIDHGADDDPFWKLPRHGAERACAAFGGVYCVIQNPEDYNLYAMAEMIEELIYVADIYGAAITLPTPDVYDEISSVVDNDLVVYTLNSGIDDAFDIGGTLFIGMDDYIAGYKGCEKMKNEYNVSKVLYFDHVDGAHDGVVNRGLGCTAAMDGNALVVFGGNVNAEIEAAKVAAALLNDSTIDAIFGLGTNGEAYGMLVWETPEDYGLDRARVDAIKGIFVVDYNMEIIEHILDDAIPTRFAIDQQPYLQGFLPMYLLAIRATTGQHLAEPTLLYSGPAFVSTVAHMEVLQCTTQAMYYCGDDEEHLANIPEGCECIDTLSKTIYLFHHGGDESGGSALTEFYTILTNGARQAAEDMNITLEIVTSSSTSETQLLNLNTYLDDIQTVIDEKVDDMDVIITTVPNEDIGAAFLSDSLSAIQVIGIADSYSIYKDLVFPSSMEPMFIGIDDESAGNGMAELVHLKAIEVNLYPNDTQRAILCLDEQLGQLASMNARCDGVEAYAVAEDLLYVKVEIDQSNVEASLDNIQTEIEGLYTLHTSAVEVLGMVATGDASCLAAEIYIEKQEEEDDEAEIAYFSKILGCFDTTEDVLEKLLENHIDFVYEQQPYLIGYFSVIMAANQAILGMIPSQELVETGPRLMTIDDAEFIYTKQCENEYRGYEFCPTSADIVSQLEMNFPTFANGAGLLLLILFVLTIVMNIIIWVLMYLWRNEAMFRGLQWEFMTLTMIGGAVMMLSGLLATSGADDTIGMTITRCNAPYAVWSVGFTLFFCSYSLRVWKVVVMIENGLLFKHRPVTKRAVALRLAMFVFIDIILIIFASTVTPFEVNELVSYPNSNEAFEEDTVFISIRTTHCRFSDSNFSSMWILVLVYKFCLLLWVISIAMRKQILADKVRKLRFMKFEEGSNIAVGIYMVIVSFLIFALIGFAMVTSSSVFTANLQWIICSFLSWLCYCTIMACVILHRIIYVYKKNKLKGIESDIAPSGSANLKDGEHSSKNAVASNTDREVSSAAFSVSGFDDDADALDPYLQRAEYLANELLDVISHPNFKQSAANSLAQIMRKLSEKISRKEMSVTGLTEVTQAQVELA